ncbi:hypothetical protein KJ903_01405 [Patescibacteria group bacterium]|nr:hypothetical protein [Patescibacteria group bacterium]
MDYFGIIKRAAKITWQAKYLWIFGLLAGFGGSSFNYNPSSSWQDNGSNSSSGEQAMNEIKNFLTDNWIWIVIVVLALLVIGLIFFVLSVIARGALVHCVDRIDGGKPTSFKDGFRIGAKKFLPMLASNLAMIFILLGTLVVLGVPVGLLFYYQMTLRAILLLLFALVIYIPLGFVVSFIAIWSWQYIVIKNMKVVESWRAGLLLFKNNLGASLIMWLLLFVVGLVTGIAFLIIVLVVAIPFVLLGVLAYAVVQWMGVAVVAAAGVMFLFLLSLLYGAVLSTFQSAVWTLMFREIEQKK